MSMGEGIFILIAIITGLLIYAGIRFRKWYKEHGLEGKREDRRKSKRMYDSVWVARFEPYEKERTQAWRTLDYLVRKYGWHLGVYRLTADRILKQIEYVSTWHEKNTYYSLDQVFTQRFLDEEFTWVSQEDAELIRKHLYRVAKTFTWASAFQGGSYSLFTTNFLPTNKMAVWFSSDREYPVKAETEVFDFYTFQRAYRLLKPKYIEQCKEMCDESTKENALMYKKVLEYNRQFSHLVNEMDINNRIVPWLGADNPFWQTQEQPKDPHGERMVYDED